MKIRTETKKLFITIVFFIFSDFTILKAQNLLSESFENSFPPQGWTIINAGIGNNWMQNTDPAYAKSGVNSMKYPIAASNANAWAITAAVNMTVGNTYSISFWCRRENFNSDKLIITIGDDKTVASQTTVLAEYNVFSTGYIERIITYSPATSGNHYIGFNCLSLPIQGNLYIDDVVIKQNAPPKAIYVRSNSTGLNNGTSWTNAYTALTAAIAAAAEGDTIKIAKGIYKPTTGNDRNSTFMLKNYTVILGGYPNTGNPTDADRKWGQNETVLSGSVDPSNYWNSRHIVSAVNTGSQTIIDGLIIEDGYSDPEYRSSGPDLRHFGSGIKFSASSATVRNCIFRNNRAYDFGAPLSIENKSNPIISNCFFITNGETFGYGNSNVYVNGSSAPQFINCVFAKNNGKPVIYSDSSNVKIINCTFFDNRVSSYSDAHVGTIFAKSNSQVDILNTIFYQNKYGYSQDSSDFKSDASIINIANSITQVSDYGNSNYQGVQPKFTDTSLIAGVDGIYFTSDDGLQLMNPCSPAINAGLNTAITNVPKDILGNNRQFGNAVDLGPYELQGVRANIPTTLYVNKSATGANNGTSWANAFTDLQKALQYCSDTIRVASGTYEPSANSELVSFWLENKRVILGGYPNTGNPTDNMRNSETNLTVLSGKLPNGNGFKSNIIIRGNWLDSTSVVDGFIITESDWKQVYSAVDNSRQKGGICLLVNSSPVFRNCILKNHNENASLMVKTNSAPLFINCKFEADTYNQNAAVVCESSAKPFFDHCIFSKNNQAVWNTNASPKFDSCIFAKNLAGISNNVGSMPTIKNSLFISNGVNGQKNAPDMLNDNSSPIVNNCLFIDSTYADYGGSVINLNNSKPVFTHCEFRNGQAVYDGGIIYNDRSDPVFNSCIFLKSKTIYGTHSAVYNNLSTAVFNNCTASDNTGFLFNRKSSPIITNSVIVNNYGQSIRNLDSSYPRIYNSIFWKNIGLNAKDFVDSSTTTSTFVFNSITQNYGVNGVDGNMVGIDPRFKNVTNPAGYDNKYFTDDDGIILCDCSPAINTGSNNAVTNIAFDAYGKQRVYGTAADMGLYEFQSNATQVTRGYYVNSKATGNNDGLSWSNAYKDLQTALLNTCADTIKIAGGIYKPAIKSRDSSFIVNRNLVIFGSYPPSGNPADNARNLELYPTILDGNIGNTADSIDNSMTVLKLESSDTSILIDGLVIQNAQNINSTYPYVAGGIYASNNKDLHINNCKLNNNYGYISGGMYSIRNKNLHITKTVFSNNSSVAEGGGLSTTGNENGLIENCVFVNNKTVGRGGGISTDDDSFINVVFTDNQGATGAAAFTSLNPAFTNCTFFNNYSPGVSTQGVGIYNYDGLGTVRNCIFIRNRNDGIAEQQLYLDFYNNIIYNSGRRLDVKYSKFESQTESFYWNNNNIAGFARFADSTNPVGPDGKWFTDDDGLKLSPCSEILDKGTNTAVSGFNTDIRSKARIFNSIVDPGAYEYQGLSDVLNPSVSVARPSNPLCFGATATFTATSSAGGTAPTFQWLNGDTILATGSNYTTNTLPVGVTNLMVVMVSNASCVNNTTDTLVFNVMVSPVLNPSVSITASSDSICAGEQVTFTALDSNAGSTPSFIWQLNGNNVGTNNKIYSSNTLANGDQVKLVMQIAGCSTSPTAISNSIGLTVNPIVVPTISISGNTVLQPGLPATISSNISNGGNSPTYQWQDSSINNNWTNIPGAEQNTVSYSSVEGNKIRCRLVSNANCTNIDTVFSNILQFGLATGIPSPPVNPYEIGLFPNPAEHTLTINNLRVTDKWESLQVVNSTGNQVKIIKINPGSTVVHVEVQNQPSGLYFILLKNHKGVTVALPFVKQ
jgi:hypothetical protein